ncbi:MAG: aminodeoxychorismate lyase [Rhodanobacter sp.]
MASRMLVNGVVSAVVAAADRGFSYGDGLFESIRFVGERAPLWERHMQRLADSCRRLQLPLPDTAQLLREARQVSESMAHAVVRIAWTRGVGERGYSPPTVATPTRVVAAFPPPPMDAAAHAHGVRTRMCTLRLAEQPQLAGMKHLNRLEQVLARAEWSDPAIAEGLLCDGDGRLVSATMANLFAVIDGELATPSLQRCGVAGVARAEILACAAGARERDMRLPDLHRASEVFLSSSVRGVVPVQSLDGWRWTPGPVTRQWQGHWRQLGFAMEHAA